MNNTAKYAWSFSRNSSFLRGLFYYTAPCTLCSEKNYHLCFRLYLRRFLVDFSTFCTIGKRNEYPTIYLLTYLLYWWHHNCVTLHATNVCFIELLFNIKYIEFWIGFEDKILIKNLWKCKRFYARRLTKHFIQKIKRWWLSAKVANNGFDRTHSRKRSATVVSKCDVFTLGSVETQLRWFCKFCWFFVKYLFLFPWDQKV